MRPSHRWFLDQGHTVKTEIMKTKWQDKLNDDPIPWLLESNPWTKYKTLVDLMEMSPLSNEVIKAKRQLFDHPQIKQLIAETSDWFPQCIARHDDSKLCYYKLMMLAEFGITTKDERIPNIIEQVLAHTDDDMFAVREVLPEKGDHSKPDLSVDEWHALPCDSPIMAYSLLRLNVSDPKITKAIDKLAEKWNTKEGWFCHFFFVDGMYKKLNISCQMAGLMALQVFSQTTNFKESPEARNAYEPLRFHREYGQTMYYFGRSKRFWTLKYPFIWYNALYLADVLTRFEFIKKEVLVKELIDWIENSQDNAGRFTPTAMFMPYKGWDFANKKEPSPWITFICCRILKQWYG